MRSSKTDTQFKIGIQCYLGVLSLLDFNMQIAPTDKIYTSFYGKPTIKNLCAFQN